MIKPEENLRRGRGKLAETKALPIADVELRFWGEITRPPSSNDEIIYVHKDWSFISRLDAVLSQVSPKRMIEIGILDGGSYSQYKPERLVVFDKAAEAPYLTRFLSRNGLTNKVRAHLAVLQGNGHRLRAVTRHEFASGSVDAIMDDASHQYADTKAAFEVLFPFLRSGGVYIIEDWAWGHEHDWPSDLWADRPLMSPLITELMLVCGHGSGVVEKVEIDPNFCCVWRGPKDLPRDGEFKLEDHYRARGFSVAL